MHADHLSHLAYDAEIKAIENPLQRNEYKEFSRKDRAISNKIFIEIGIDFSRKLARGDYWLLHFLARG